MIRRAAGGSVRTWTEAHLQVHQDLEDYQIDEPPDASSCRSNGLQTCGL